VTHKPAIAQHFAADHPDLVRRLVIHSSAYTLRARQRKWREAWVVLLGFMIPSNGFSKICVS